VRPLGLENGRVSFSGSGPQKERILYGGKAKGEAGGVRYGLWGAGEGGGGDVWVWMCRISLGMVRLRYIRPK
jgi:hypothetical protein